MGNVKMGTDGSYRTSDLYIAAWLLSRGLGLKDIDRCNKQRSDFIFRDRSDRPEPVKHNRQVFPLRFAFCDFSILSEPNSILTGKVTP